MANGSGSCKTPREAYGTFSVEPCGGPKDGGRLLRIRGLFPDDTRRVTVVLRDGSTVRPPVKNNMVIATFPNARASDLPVSVRWAFDGRIRDTPIPVPVEEHPFRCRRAG